jgi:SP family xylose:H+ symportor-like MFS transporter
MLVNEQGQGLDASPAGAGQDDSKINSVVICAAIVAALGGLLFGFDTAVISGATDWLQSIYRLSPAMKGFTVSSALIGTLIGSIAVGKPADKYGRREILFVLAILYFVTAVGCAMANNLWVFVAFRFLGGLAVGGASVVSPMYIAEIAPAKFRGRLVSVTQFNIVLGILLAYLSNYIISSMNLGDVQYRWMFGVQAAPAVAFFALLFTTPQSPRWLIAKGRASEGREVLLRCGASARNIDTLVGEIQQSLDTEHHATDEPFFTRKYAKPIMLAVAIAMFNQLSGINALMYYASEIFTMAGASKESAFLQPVIVGIVNLAFTMAAMTVIDKIGRRKLMLVGSIGYIISLSVTAYLFYTHTGGPLVLASLLVFIASHAFGQGAVIWVFISEIFPNRVRSQGQALGSFTHWVMAAAISWTFPIIAAYAGWMTFAFYALCSVGQLVWVLTRMPETKGVSLENIQKQLGIE